MQTHPWVLPASDWIVQTAPAMLPEQGMVQAALLAVPAGHAAGIAAGE
jgi:hypothetical protein